MKAAVTSAEPLEPAAKYFSKVALTARFVHIGKLALSGLALLCSAIPLYHLEDRDTVVAKPADSPQVK
jgi:hypothetical protein